MVASLVEERGLQHAQASVVVVFCCSIKQIEAPYVFDWDPGVALQAMQGNRASSPAEGDVSWHFSSCGRNPGYIFELQRGWPFETPLCSAKSGFLSSYDGHLRNLN